MRNINKVSLKYDLKRYLQIHTGLSQNYRTVEVPDLPITIILVEVTPCFLDKQIMIRSFRRESSHFEQIMLLIKKLDNVKERLLCL